MTSLPESGEGLQPLVLSAKELDFPLVADVFDAPIEVAAVIVSSPIFADHARKMLQEAGIALFVRSSEASLPDRCLVDKNGVISLPVKSSVSAICSVFNKRNLAEYQKFGVTKIGYFRFKFCLFRLFSIQPEAFDDDAIIESHLYNQMIELSDQHWESIRCVLSDLTSAEMREMGIDVAAEVNPDMGLRGPRAMKRWGPELRAISRFLDDHDIHIQICAPFISSADEYGEFLEHITEAGIDLSRVGVGFTLEVPSLADNLDELFEKMRVDFMGVGTSDLFALYNGIDRNSSDLHVEPGSKANTALLERVVATAASHGVPIFVCGEIRRDVSVMSPLLSRGVRELISSARMDELVSVTKLSSENNT